MTKRGIVVSSQVKFKAKLSKSNGEDKDGDDSTGFFHRRHVGFVKWENVKNFTPYETYDEMNRDLGILHNSGNDDKVNLSGSTKLLGPFGVFLSSRKRPSVSEESSDSKRPRSIQSISPAIDKLTPASSSKGTPLFQDHAPHDQLWLSNELRDDALLTAAALNGDSQFLDIMNVNGNMLTSSNLDTDALNTMFNSNPNDFLNLVFHRNHNLANTSNNENAQSNSVNSLTTNQIGSTNNAGSGSPTNMDMANILNENDPGYDPNQQMLYSNYTNYYYNNPYHFNENLEIHLHASKNPNNEDESTDMVDGDNSNTTQMPTSIMCIVQNPLQPELGFDLSIPNLPANSPQVGLPTTALQVQPLTRYLLNYYINLVADLMTVIPLTENPWKTIYFPRALMAIGELSALGKTSTAKSALLNALLAVSAFNLQSKFPKNSDSMKYYLNLGIRLRNQASLFIKQLMNSKNTPQASVEHCVSNEKYKDVLCAVMSMISVDLVWGTMQDTNFYIKWCGMVISTKMTKKKKLSSKARILHRIFLSLKLIQDSTCLDIGNIKNDFDSLGEGDKYDVNGDKFDVTRKGRIDFIVNVDTQSTKNTTPSFVNKKLINTNKYDENFATDALYGLPNSLIILFSETVQLLKTKIYHREKKLELPKTFQPQLEQVSTKLENWKLDWQLFDIKQVKVGGEQKETKQFYSSMHEATYHHILSFYHALWIYFNRFIVELPPKNVQSRVTKTLEHLNAIQALIARDKADIIPLFWQGFIAGCEATSLNLQMGFKKWGADIAQYLGSYWGARQIMLEVWRRKRMNEANDDWISVIHDWEMNLMLN
jgi:arginine metabolism regulation protein II